MNRSRPPLPTSLPAGVSAGFVFYDTTPRDVFPQTNAIIALRCGAQTEHTLYDRASGAPGQPGHRTCGASHHGGDGIGNSPPPGATTKITCLAPE